MSAVCRVCLAGNLKLNYLNDNPLINLYEKLSDTKFNSEDARPRVLCCLCYQKLLGCHTFSQMAHRSEYIFSQLYNKATHEDITRIDLGMEYLSVATTPLTVDGTTTNESSETYKDEPISVKEEVTTEEDPLMTVESVSPEDCTKIESLFHQKKHFTRLRVNRNMRKYIRKNPEAAPISEAVFKEAQRLIKDGKSQRAAAAAVGISESCLRKRLKHGTVSSSMGRFKPTFDIKQEIHFAKQCMDMSDRFFGVTINNLRRLAYEYAEANKIKNRFDKSSKMAGRDWVDGFLKRHPQLVVRQSAPSLARAVGLSKVQVAHFFKKLKELYADKKFAPSRIYNMDEKGMCTVPIRTPRAVATKGKKLVGKVVPADRVPTVTAMCCMSASGHYIPPAFIYPRARPRNDFLDDGPAQSIAMVSDSGYVNTELFLNWLQHFKYFAHPTPEDPVLLLLDNHTSHVSLDAVNFARENSIVMLTLPPHATHQLQPLDRSFFSPLKTNYSIECRKHMTRNPGRPITQHHVAGLFNKAFKKVATTGNAESGFRVTGIWPFHDGFFDGTEFAPSIVTDQVIGIDSMLELRNQIIQDNMQEPTDQMILDDNIPEPTDRQLNKDDTIIESSVTLKDDPMWVNEVTAEEDPLMKVESVSPEDCTKSESSSEDSVLGNSVELPHQTHVQQTKPFKCNLCNKQFSIKSALVRHLQSHTVKPFTCNDCDKQFKDKFALVRHAIVHTVEKPFTCNVCDKQFKQKSGFRRHKIIHTDEKRFPCNVCGKQFREKTYLDNHLRIHTGERPFACNLCDKKFNQKSALLRHTKIHTGKKTQNNSHRREAIYM